MNDSRLNIKLPTELYEALKREAKDMNISLASLIRLIGTEYLNNKAKE